jgi:phospholipase/carboxylesterase
MSDELELMQFEPCPKCGIDNDSDADTCSKCGIVFAKYDPAADATRQRPQSGYEQQTPAYGEPPSTGSHTTSSRSGTSGASFLSTFPVGRSLFLLVVAAAVAYWWFSAPYEVVGPPLGEGQSVVVLLHGYGAAGDDLVPRAETFSEGAPETTFVVLAAPHSKIMGRAWMVGGTREDAIEQVEESRALILDTVAGIEDEGVASEDIYLGGFSQGAQFALDVVAGEPVDRQFAGLVLMSGGLPNWPGSVPPLRRDNFAEDARVLISHGDSDSVVGQGQSKAVARDLRGIGVPVEFVTFAGNHTISQETTDAVIAFLNSHPR